VELSAILIRDIDRARDIVIVDILAFLTSHLLKMEAHFSNGVLNPRLRVVGIKRWGRCWLWGCFRIWSFDQRTPYEEKSNENNSKSGHMCLLLLCSDW